MNVQNAMSARTTVRQIDLGEVHRAHSLARVNVIDHLRGYFVTDSCLSFDCRATDVRRQDDVLTPAIGVRTRQIKLFHKVISNLLFKRIDPAVRIARRFSRKYIDVSTAQVTGLQSLYQVWNVHNGTSRRVQ